MGFPKSRILFLSILGILLVSIVLAEESKPPPVPSKAKQEELFELEFKDFCAKQKTLRKFPERIADGCKKIEKDEFHIDDLRMLFTLFMIILWGAIMRTGIRLYHIPLPYTVVLLFSGIFVGLFSKFFCFDVYTYTSLGRIKPAVILNTFLPVLIFETAFGISTHVFIRALSQILMTSFPGMIIATVLTAVFCKIFFSAYNWTFLQSLFFGSIISATDPVAVVAILKEVGVAESLSVLIDGESLLNDGVAILLYEIFKEMLESDGEEETSTGKMVGNVLALFFRITLGGPAFGFVMAKLSIFCLARIFNDAMVEITITLVSAYLTYYMADDMLGISGVIAVVMLGITMSSEKTCISPDILEEVNEFWEMAAHLANTILFFLTGIIISERGSRDLMWTDVAYLILLYLALTIIRLTMLAVLSPFMTRWGYGMSWQDMIVMVWGGLRGAVGICLSMEVYENPKFCRGFLLGPKILFQTAGIVVLTLLVNGTTTKKLLDMLKMTEVTQGRIEEMEVATQHIMDHQRKATTMLKHDRFLQDANWGYIHTFTKIENPYMKAKRLIEALKAAKVTSIISLSPNAELPGAKKTECPECHRMILNEPSNDEYRLMTEEARLKILKAMKISYWAQFQQGTLTEDAVKILVSVTDTVTDRELQMIKCSDLKKFWTIRGIIPRIRTKLVGIFGDRGMSEESCLQPIQKWRYLFWRVATHPFFDNIMTLIVIVSLIPAVWEFLIEVKLNSESDHCHSKDERIENLRKLFLIFNWAFCITYILEFIIKILGRGVCDYCSNKWNWIDFMVLLITIGDIVATYAIHCTSHGINFAKILKIARLARLVRSLRLIKPLIPAMLGFLNTRINKQLFLGFDVLIGYLGATDEVRKYLNTMVENPRVLRKLKEYLENEHSICVRQIGFLQKDHPGIAIAVKTKKASRMVLNQMKVSLNDLRMDGLLDEKENLLLTIALEERMKRLWTCPAYIAPSSPEVLIENLIWVYGNTELKDVIFSAATLMAFEINDIITEAGDENDGIYVIVSGMIKISYNPFPIDVELRENFGVIPIKEMYRNIELEKHDEDFFSSGAVIGESSFLLKRPRRSTVTCETDDVTAYFIPKSALDDAIELFNDPFDSLSARLWRACGIRRGIAYFPYSSTYETWSSEKIRMHLERSCVPLASTLVNVVLPSYILEIFLMEGYIQDFVTAEIYIAPCLIPITCRKLALVDNPQTENRMLIITQEDIGPTKVNDELANYVIGSFGYRRGFDIQTDDEKKNQFSKIMSFGVRQTKKRNNSFYSVDDNTKNNTKETKEAYQSVLNANSTRKLSLT